MKHFIAPEQLTTDHFIVRCYRPDDGPNLQEAVVSSYAHLKPTMPWATETQTVPETISKVRRFRANYLTNKDYCLGIFDLHGGCLGGSGFHLRHGGLETRTAEMGMWIRGTEAGKGLGSAVVKAIVDWGLSEWPWERLVWRCATTNTASRRAAENGGFELEGISRSEFDPLDGTRRDVCNYAVLKKV